MHWFGELLALYLVIAGVIFAPVSYVVTKKKQIERRLAEANYQQRIGWGRAFKQLYDANAAAIAEVESTPYSLSKTVTDELLAAHETASQFVRRI